MQTIKKNAKLRIAQQVNITQKKDVLDATYVRMDVRNALNAVFAQNAQLQDIVPRAIYVEKEMKLLKVEFVR